MPYSNYVERKLCKNLKRYQQKDEASWWKPWEWGTHYHKVPIYIRGSAEKNPKIHQMILWISKQRHETFWNKLLCVLEYNNKLVCLNQRQLLKRGHYSNFYEIFVDRLKNFSLKFVIKGVKDSKGGLYQKSYHFWIF